MGFWSVVVIIALIIGGFYILSPTKFNEVKTWLIDKILFTSSIQQANNTQSVLPLQMNERECTTDKDCQDYYGLTILKCAPEGYCYKIP